MLLPASFSKAFSGSSAKSKQPQHLPLANRLI
jgi:hypothetical protein